MQVKRLLYIEKKTNKCHPHLGANIQQSYVDESKPTFRQNIYWAFNSVTFKSRCNLGNIMFFPLKVNIKCD